MPEPKILVVSNFFPPIAYGGYEIACAQIVDGLRTMGFRTKVLTSSHRSRECVANETDISRTLRSSLKTDFGKLSWPERFRRLLALELWNQRCLCEAVENFRPDLIYFWNLGYTSKSLLALAARRRWRHGCFIFDYSLLDACADAWGAHVELREGNFLSNSARALAGAFGRLLGQPGGGKPAPDFVHYPTDYLRGYHEEQNFPNTTWVKVRWGVDERIFHPRERTDHPRLLFIGQISEHKGAHLVLEALGLLREEGFPNLLLTMAGQCLSEEYRGRLDSIIRCQHLEQVVSFRGFVRRENLPELYSEHAILVFPSVWEEPMGIVVLEAMACGMAVISSGTGGSGELIRDGVDGLLFTSGDPADCARKIARLCNDPEFSDKIRKNARQAVLERFRLEATLQTIAQDLKRRSIPC